MSTLNPMEPNTHRLRHSSRETDQIVGQELASFLDAKQRTR